MYILSLVNSQTILPLRTCTNPWLRATDKQIWDASLHVQGRGSLLGKCFHYYGYPLCAGCACNHYSKLYESPEQLPDLHGTGCLDGCWGPPNTYMNYLGTDLDICSGSYEKKNANMMKIGIRKGHCGLPCNCSDGEVWSTTPPYVCISCTVAGCETCLGNSCQKCLSQFIISNGNCFCLAGKYRSDNNCLLCHSSCLTCSGGAPAQCTTCQPTYYRVLVGNECQCFVGFVQTEDGTCTCDTSNGFFMDGSEDQFQCKACFSLCLTCFGPLQDECLSCRNSELVGTKCNCFQGQYLNQTTCVPCNNQCLECSSESDCQTCKVRINVAQEIKCLCLANTYFNGTLPCLRCPSNCDLCVKGICSSCYMGFVLDTATNTCNCPAGEKLVRNVCLTKESQKIELSMSTAIQVSGGFIKIILKFKKGASFSETLIRNDAMEFYSVKKNGTVKLEFVNLTVTTDSVITVFCKQISRILMQSDQSVEVMIMISEEVAKTAQLPTMLSASSNQNKSGVDVNVLLISIAGSLLLAVSIMLCRNYLLKQKNMAVNNDKKTECEQSEKVDTQRVIVSLS